MCKTTLFILRIKKIVLETSVRKYWYLFLLFFLSDVQLKAYLSFLFGLFRLGLAAGNLRLMFGQFTIQVRNYITTPPLPFPLESGRLRCPSNSCQCLALWSDVWLGTAPCDPPHSAPNPHTPPVLLHSAPPLRNLHCDWRRDRQERRVCWRTLQSQTVVQADL